MTKTEPTAILRQVWEGRRGIEEGEESFLSLALPRSAQVLHAQACATRIKP